MLFHLSFPHAIDVMDHDLHPQAGSFHKDPLSEVIDCEEKTELETLRNMK